MKNFMTIGKSLRRFALCAAMALPFTTGCTTIEEYDDSEIKEQIDLIINKLYELEQKMNAEIQALKDMLSGKIMITSVSTDTSTGITTVTLTNGSKLQLYPQKDLQSFVTYITLSDGVSYWAYIDENGKKQLFLDENGEAIPVISDVPEVVVKDGETYLKIGGVEYPLSGNSVFSDYELITDELTGEVYAVTFTFGEGMSFTVTVEGACGFYFVKPSGWSTVAIQDYYVASGMTERVQVEARGVVDYVLQIPDGWRVKEYEDIYMGALYFDITAPSAELIKNGAAAADGDLKVVAVLEGGKATVAKLYLSTNPFKEFSVSLGKADVKMYNGLQKFVYGVCEASKYNELTILPTAQSLLTAYDYPAGYGVSESDLEGISVEVVAGKKLVAGTQYVFWAIPAIYFESNDDAGYFLKSGTFVKQAFSYASVEFAVGNESITDAQLVMNLKGVNAYYTGVAYKEDFMIEDIVYNLNNPGYYTAKTSPMTYEGSVFEFAGVEAEKATEYVAWIAVAEDGKTYSEADVVISEFATLDLVAGSSVKVVADNVKESSSDIEISLTATGAETIYYAYLTKTEAARYATEDDKVSYLLGKGVSVNGTSVVAKASDMLEAKPGTDYVLWALASDASGKYGAVTAVECKTKVVAFNNIKVSLTLEKNDPGNVVIGVAAEGAVDYLYWIGRTADNIWKSPSYLGGSAAKAQQYMSENAGHERFTKVMEAYPVVDGKITMTDLTAGTNYVIVMMAVDKDGTYSNAVELKFTPRSKAVGNVVLASDPKWEAARPTIEWNKAMFEAAAGLMSGQYGFNITVPEGFTAYVLAGTDDYLTMGNPQLVLSPEEKIVSIIEYADSPRDSEVLVSDELWTEKGFPHGWDMYHFEHGNPLFGNAVIWASEEFHDKVCNCKDHLKTEREYNGEMFPITQVRFINDGAPVEFRQPQAIGDKTKVVDRVFVVCQDLDGNCYEAFEYDVPIEYFK